VSTDSVSAAAATKQKAGKRQQARRERRSSVGAVQVNSSGRLMVGSGNTIVDGSIMAKALQGSLRPAADARRAPAARTSTKRSSASVEGAPLPPAVPAHAREGDALAPRESHDADAEFASELVVDTERCSRILQEAAERAFEGSRPVPLLDSSCDTSADAARGREDVQWIDVPSETATAIELGRCDLTWTVGGAHVSGMAHMRCMRS
jgi:hypothetical protein